MFWSCLYQNNPMSKFTTKYLAYDFVLLILSDHSVSISGDSEDGMNNDEEWLDYLDVNTQETNFS